MASITRARKSAEQRKHDHYLKLAQMIRQGRLHRVSVDGHSEHVFADGEHVDFYASSRYAGFAYMVVGTDHGYECGCESFEHRHTCPHILDASARAKARYHEAQNELDEAAAIAPAVLGSFATDLPVHLDDEMPGQADAFEQVYAALTFGTVNDASLLARTLRIGVDAVVNVLSVLQASERIVLKHVSDEKYYVDTPSQAYRMAFASDFAA